MVTCNPFSNFCSALTLATAAEIFSRFATDSPPFQRRVTKWEQRKVFIAKNGNGAFVSKRPAPRRTGLTLFSELLRPLLIGVALFK